MIRLFSPADTRDTALVWLRSGQDEYHYLPAFQQLDEADAVNIFEDVILKQCTVRVFETDSAIRGFLAMNGSYIDRLYVDPDAQGMGVGTAMLEHAKALCPDGLSLHTHQQNHRAREFYEKSGFTAVKFGLSPPPESMPDVEYRWRKPADRPPE